MFIKEENLLEELDEEVRQIVDASKEYGLNNKETAFAVACYEYFDFTLEEVLEMVERNVINVSEYNPNLVENDIWSVEAWVFDDYSKAENQAKEDIKELIDEIGVEGFNVDIEDFVDTDWFEDSLVESFEFYCNDIANEEDDTYGNRLVQECYDSNLITDDDFELDEDGNIDYTDCKLSTEDLTEKYVEQYKFDLWHDYNSPVQAYIDMLGKESFDSAIKEYPDIIDTDKLAEYCVDEDGPKNNLASYDGEEYEVEIGDSNIYYVYRTN